MQRRSCRSRTRSQRYDGTSVPRLLSYLALIGALPSVALPAPEYVYLIMQTQVTLSHEDVGQEGVGVGVGIMSLHPTRTTTVTLPVTNLHAAKMTTTIQFQNERLPTPKTRLVCSHDTVNIRRRFLERSNLVKLSHIYRQKRPSSKVKHHGSFSC
jgi:hypothetical protein